MSDRDSDFGAFLAGFVLGGLAGAFTALLLAPQSGEETRTQIRDKSIELKEKLLKLQKIIASALMSYQNWQKSEQTNMLLVLNKC